MAFLFRQSAQNSTGSGTTVIITPTSSLIKGSLVVVNLKLGDQATTVSSVVDSAGNTYALAAGPIDGSGGLRAYQYYGVQVTGGATTVTVTLTGAIAHRDTIDEFSSNLNSNTGVFDKMASNAGSGNSSSVTLAPSRAGNLIAVGVAMSGFSAITAGTNYVLGTNNTNASTEYRLIGTTSETAPMSWTTSGNWVEIVGSYFGGRTLAVGRTLASGRTLSASRFLITDFVSSLSFNGGTNNVQFSGPAFGLTGTIMFWIKKNVSAIDRYVMDSTNGHRYLFYQAADGGWGFYLDSTLITDNGFNSVFNLVNFGTWTHVAITWDSSLPSNKEKFYKNSVLFAQRNVTFSTSSTPTNFWLNQRFDTTQNATQLLDDFIICSTALSQTEINNYYFNRTQPTSTINRWKMNEGSGSSLIDSVGSLTGTITGATYSTDIVSKPRTLAV